jgi:ABC-type transport system involved in multi-copper enzyme maturation permease subunit
VFLLLVPTGIAILIRHQAPPGTIAEFMKEGLPSILLGIIQLMCLFHGAGLVRDGMEDKTLQYLLTRPIGRSRVVFGLYSGMLSYILPLGLVSAAAGFVACRAGLPMGIFAGPDQTAMFIRLLAITALVIVFYGALYTLFGLVFRMPTIIALISLVVVDGILGSMPGPPRLISPLAYFEVLLTRAPDPAATDDARDFVFETRASASRIHETLEISHSTAFIVLGVAFFGILFLMHYLSRGKDFIVFAKKQP